MAFHSNQQVECVKTVAQVGYLHMNVFFFLYDIIMTVTIITVL